MAKPKQKALPGMEDREIKELREAALEYADAREARNPERMPHRLTPAKYETCCFCGQQHASGIFVRESPANAPHCPAPPPTRESAAGGAVA